MIKQPKQIVFTEDDFASDSEGVTIWNIPNPMGEEFETAKRKAWIDMCAAVDDQDDFHRLLELIKTFAPPATIQFVQDLFERHHLKGFSGRSTRTPLYKFSPKMALLQIAVEDVKRLVERGMKRADAIKKITEQYVKDYPRHRFTESNIRLACENKHRALREELDKVRKPSRF